MTDRPEGAADRDADGTATDATGTGAAATGDAAAVERDATAAGDPTAGADPTLDGDAPGIPRDRAVDVVESVVDAVETDLLPVPVREVWVYGDLALGVDPVERLDVYLAKDVLVGGEGDPDGEYAAEFGVRGVGSTVRADWAREHPEYLRTGPNGYAAPEKCLAAHLLPDGAGDDAAGDGSGAGGDGGGGDSGDVGEGGGGAGADGDPGDGGDGGDGERDFPIHLEVCNAGFEDNVRRRVAGARETGDYAQALDPRGVALYVEGVRDDDAFDRLRASDYAFPPLTRAFGMLGLDPEAADRAAEAVHAWRSEAEGVTVRGDVV